jgi:hypothetical protein
MFSLHDRFFFFSISNSILLFEQSSHLLTLIVCVGKPNLLTFFFCLRMDELLLFVIQLCV